MKPPSYLKDIVKR